MPLKRPYWESRVTRYPTHPRKVVERVSWIAPFVSRGAWRPPGAAGLEPRVENQQQLVQCITATSATLAGLARSRAFLEFGTAASAGGVPGPARATCSAPIPPVHSQLRRLVSRDFTPRRIRELEPRIREIAAGIFRCLFFSRA